MAAPNLRSTTAITGKTAIQAVANSPTAIVSNGAASGVLQRVTSLYIANLTAGAVAITVDFYRSTTAYAIASTVSVPGNSSIVIIDKNAPVNVEEGDAIRLTAGAGSSLTAVASYEIIS